MENKEKNERQQPHVKNKVEDGGLLRLGIEWEEEGKRASNPNLLLLLLTVARVESH